MFPRSFFAGRYFAPRFFPQSQGLTPAVAPSAGATITGRVPVAAIVEAALPGVGSITGRVPADQSVTAGVP